MITFTNDQKDVIDSLHKMLITEFESNIRNALDFEPDQLTRGEYFRYALSETEHIENHSDGETTNYIIPGGWYFAKTDRYFKNIFDDHVSKRLERLKRLLRNNRSYTVSGSYKWHGLIYTFEEPVYLSETGDEYEKYTDILYIPVEITITRSNFS